MSAEGGEDGDECFNFDELVRSKLTQEKLEDVRKFALHLFDRQIQPHHCPMQAIECVGTLLQLLFSVNPKSTDFDDCNVMAFSLAWIEFCFVLDADFCEPARNAVRDAFIEHSAFTFDLLCYPLSSIRNLTVSMLRYMASNSADHGEALLGRDLSVLQPLLHLCATDESNRPKTPSSGSPTRALGQPSATGDDATEMPRPMEVLSDFDLEHQQVVVLDLLGVLSNSDSFKHRSAAFLFPVLVRLCRHPADRVECLALLALSNFALLTEFQLQLTEEGAADWLVPLMYSTTPRVQFDCCVLLGSLFLAATPDNEVNEKLEHAGAVDAMVRFLRHANPVDFTGLYTYHEPDIQFYCRMLLSSRSAVQAAGAFVLANASYAASHRALLAHPRVVACIVSIAASTTTEPVYRFLSLVLENLRSLYDIPIPPFNRHVGFRDANSGLVSDASSVAESTEAAAAETRRGHVAMWSEDEVAAWVKTQRFACYERNFRDGWVDGEVLLALNERLLADMGITHGVHQMVILRCIQGLAAQHVGEAAAAAADGEPQAATTWRQISDFHVDLDRSLRARSHFDVFISYRRCNGSQFAQLVKVHLRLAGYDVFLDVDGLREGRFEDGLLQSLRASTNVVVLLTANALDRCLQDADNKDWVRKEIAAAIAMRKNVVPVLTKDFVFPDHHLLPEDIRDVVSHNCVEWSHTYQEASIKKLKGFLHK